jgi:hypothetical protein
VLALPGFLCVCGPWLLPLRVCGGLSKPTPPAG